ncbi:MAG: Uma2 family endonuclease [Planctomycetes bacterium]|nr:Uma2 family endonuclease [Planctomycetota bacterium]
MATITRTQQFEPNHCFLLTDVSWELYQLLGEELRERPIRMTYDRGTLEMMTTSLTHEFFKTFLGRMIETICLEMDIAARGGGSMTFQRDDLARGFEPDECYWIANQPAMADAMQFDPLTMPPPDLGVEIDISRSSVPRQPIFAAFGIPELWRFDGEQLSVLHLGAGGEYHAAESSLSFPFLPVGELSRFLRFEGSINETKQIRTFVDWIRGQGFAKS